jgi:hypothetical protein
MGKAFTIFLIATLALQSARPVLYVLTGCKGETANMLLDMKSDPVAPLDDTGEEIPAGELPVEENEDCQLHTMEVLPDVQRLDLKSDPSVLPNPRFASPFLDEVKPPPQA